MKLGRSLTYLIQWFSHKKKIIIKSNPLRTLADEKNRRRTIEIMYCDISITRRDRCSIRCCFFEYLNFLLPFIHWVCVCVPVCVFRILIPIFFFILYNGLVEQMYICRDWTNKSQWAKCFHKVCLITLIGQQMDGWKLIIPKIIKLLFSNEVEYHGTTDFWSTFLIKCLLTALFALVWYYTRIKNSSGFCCLGRVIRAY